MVKGIDMNKYSGWSNFDINRRIAILEGINFEAYPDFHPDAYVFSEDLSREIDYCLNWGDMGPLAFKYKISLWYGRNNPSKCVASYGCFERTSSENENPLRSAAEVYLMIKEGN